MRASPQRGQPWVKRGCNNWCTEGCDAHQGCLYSGNWELFSSVEALQGFRSHHLGITGAGVESIIRYHLYLW